MTEENGKKKRRHVIPFKEKLAEVDGQIASAMTRVAELKAKRERMVQEHGAKAAQMLEEIGHVATPVIKQEVE